MSAMLQITPGERGQIRVFAINRPAADIAAMLAAAPKADVARALLGAPHLDTKSAELFPVSDLDGLGLAQYLVEGYEVPEETLSEDRRKLDALDGYVLLIFSDSFGGAAAELTPSADLTAIGSYAETLPDHRQRPTVTPSAALYSGTHATSPVSARRGSAMRVLLLVALAVALGLMLWAAT